MARWFWYQLQHRRRLIVEAFPVGIFHFSAFPSRTVDLCLALVWSDRHILTQAVQHSGKHCAREAKNEQKSIKCYLVTYVLFSFFSPIFSFVSREIFFSKSLMFDSKLS